MTVDFHTSRGHGFSFTTGKERSEPTRIQPRRPGSKDLSNSLQANEAMLIGLYHGNWSGLQFASPLCAVPINLIAQMMGYPTPTSEDERTQAALDEITAGFGARIAGTHRGSLLVGNAWRWPRYDAKNHALVLESIRDSVVSDILVDVATENATSILVDEQIKVSVGENKTITGQRKRIFTPDAVSVRWIGQRPISADDYSARNIAGMLPVNFANDPDEGEIRGYSLFSRVIRTMKDYHDIAFRISETLAKFRVKQIQNVEDSNKWLENNGITAADLSHLDISDLDFVMNRGAGESTKYEFLPEGATTALEKALEREFLTIVEGTLAPELFWGPLATGNHASTETQMQQAVDYANAKRKEFSKAWSDVYTGCLRVLSVARMESFAPFKMGWNRLESVSAEVKARILSSFAQAANALVQSATCTKKQLFTLWELNFPESKPGSYEDFIQGIAEMATHKQFVGEMYGAGLEDLGAGLEGAGAGAK